jgi:hypothetical protein
MWHHNVYKTTVFVDRRVGMKYQAVILNFDRKTVQYVAPKDVSEHKKAVTSVSGSNPPAPKKAT